MIASGQGHILEEEEKNKDARDPNKTSMVKRDRKKKKRKGEEDRARAESLQEDQEEVKEEVKEEQAAKP
jgi:hypothetical protein